MVVETETNDHLVELLRSLSHQLDGLLCDRDLKCTIFAACFSGLDIFDFSHILHLKSFCHVNLSFRFPLDAGLVLLPDDTAFQFLDYG